MTFFVQPTKAPKVDDRTRAIMYCVAGALVVLTLLMLFRFERMPTVVEDYPVFGVLPVLGATVLVALQVGALPFLLQLPLSRLARLCSVFCGVLAIGSWLLVNIWATVSSETGFVADATIGVPLGLATLSVTGLVVLGFAYVVYYTRHHLSVR